jgi:hypothetical protein
MFTIACLMLFGWSHHAEAQFGFAGFGKAKPQRVPVLDPKGPPAKSPLLNFGGVGNALSMEGPVSVVKRFNDNTQQALAEARAAIARPFVDLKNDMRQWTTREPNTPGKFQLVPDWMKPGAPPQPQQPATLGDWLSQDRPQ